jgi:peptidyl-prolyl cis-trans isomerase D
MTGSLRKTARNPVGIALMGLLILVFLVLGVGGGGRFPDLFRTASADSVVAAGAHATSSRDFKRIFEQEKQRVEQRAQQSIPMDVLIQNGFDQQLLGEIALDQATAEMLSRSGIDPAPSLVDGEIKKLPWAFDRITGKFNEKQFLQGLADQGLTPSQAQAELSDELAQRHFGYAIEAGFRAPRIFAALSAMAGLENRDVSYFTLDAHAVPQPSTPTDAQLVTFMKEHAAQITRPEMRVIDLVRFSAKALEPGVTIDPAAVEKEFNFKKDSLSTPEKRTLIQIPVRTPVEGAQAAARLTKGEDPSAIAKSFGAEPVSYADKPMSAIADHKLATAVFAMKEGQVSGPVQGDLGLAAIKIVKITPGVTATLASARAQIEAQMRTKAAQDQAYSLSQKFDEARQGGSNIPQAAAKAGVTPVAIGPVTIEGVGLDHKQNPLLTEKILKSAFSHAASEDTDLEDAGAGEYFALRVEKVLAPALPPLDEVRPALTQAYMAAELMKTLRARADALMQQVRKGQTLDQAAAQVGGHVTHQTGLQRIQAQSPQYKALGNDFLNGVFSAKPGDVFEASAPNGVFIARLDAVRPGDVTATARLVESVRGRLSQSYVGDLMSAVKTAARASVKTTINLNLARQSLGVDPATAPAAGVKPGATAPARTK